MPTRDCLALSFELRGPRPAARRGRLPDLRRLRGHLQRRARRCGARAGRRRGAAVARDATAGAVCRRCGRRPTQRRAWPARSSSNADRIEPQLLGARAWEREWLRDFHALRFGSPVVDLPAPRAGERARRGRRDARSGARLRHRHASLAPRCAWSGSTPHVTPAHDAHRLRLGLRNTGHRRRAARRRPRGRLRHRPAGAAGDRRERRRQWRRRATLACTPMRRTLPSANRRAGGQHSRRAPVRTGRAALPDWSAPGGQILLAGILAEQAEVVAEAYAPWFDIAPWAERDGWVALAGNRKS